MYNCSASAKKTLSQLSCQEEKDKMMWHILCAGFILVLKASKLMIVTAAMHPAEKCDYDKVTFHFSNSTLCKPCRTCRRGRGPSLACGSVVNIKENGSPPRIRCRRCQKGTYSDSPSILMCKPCTKCTSEFHVIRNCTPYSDTICHSCREGFYFNNKTSSCLPCWRCCGDGKDERIDECMTQGSHRHCSFDTYIRCHYSSDRNLTGQPDSVIGIKFTYKSTTTSRVNLIRASANGIKENRTRFWKNIGISTFFLLISFLTIVIIFKIRKRSLHKKTHKGERNNENILYHYFATSDSEDKNLSVKNNQSDELDDWAKYDSMSGMYLFKCGANIRHDKTSGQDANRNLVVEILHNSLASNLRTLDPDYIFISPIFKFYSQGTQFEKPVEITLPHNALIDKTNKNWEIKVLYVDEREGKAAKWKEIECEVNIEWDKMKFSTKTLLTYAVVGRPMEKAKKRMQFALFSMEKMISDRLEMVLYLLDEGNTSLDRVIKENKSKGWEMIGSLYAVFVDCFSPVDIVINVDELLEPWSLVHLKDKVISSQLLQDSYFNIPTVHTKFRRSKRNAQKFYCNFRVDVGGSEINIPAVTFVPEELLCVYVDVHNEDPSIFDNQTLARDMPYDINYLMCRKLDVPAKGLGQWRDFGRHFKLTEEDLQECCREYATLDGSPSKALVEMICDKNPKLTIGEFAKCLEKLGRCDVMSVLSKVK